MKNNIVARWLADQKKAGKNKTQCAAKLTKLCGGAMRVNEICRWENGDRFKFRCAHYIMLLNTILETNAEFGFKRDKAMSAKKLDDYVRAMLPPEKEK